MNILKWFLGIGNKQPKLINETQQNIAPNEGITSNNSIKTNNKDASNEISRNIIKLENDDTYNNNQDIIDKLVFYATLQITTPLKVLKNHGKTFKGKPSKAPSYNLNKQEFGVWIYKTKTWKDVGIDIPELENSEFASDVGPVEDKEYIPFLIEFRSIVEQSVPVNEKLTLLDNLFNQSDLFSSYRKRLEGFYGDFPRSFFYNEFTQINGIGSKSAKLIFDSGISTVEELSRTPLDELLKTKGIGKSMIDKIQLHFSKQ